MHHAGSLFSQCTWLNHLILSCLWNFISLHECPTCNNNPKWAPSVGLPGWLWCLCGLGCLGCNTIFVWFDAYWRIFIHFTLIGFDFSAFQRSGTSDIDTNTVGFACSHITRISHTIECVYFRWFQDSIVYDSSSEGAADAPFFLTLLLNTKPELLRIYYYPTFFLG